MLTTRTLATLLSLAAIVTAGSACQPDTEPTPNVASPTTAPPATTPPASPARDEALTAYRGMWAAFVEAAKTSNPDAPDIRTYTSDNALKLIVNGLYVNRSDGKVTLGDVVLDPTVTATEPEDNPTQVTIADCVNDETWLVYWASGGLVNDVPGGRHNTTATVVKTADGWKVSAFTLRGSGTC